MKNLSLILIALLIAVFSYGQTSKTVDATAGGLFSALTTEELTTITNLTLSGTIDARDFKTMRDDMPLLADIDLSGVTVVAYTGTEGTFGPSSFDYPENTIPQNAFWNAAINDGGKKSLISVLLPSSLTSIGIRAFELCSSLTSINFPSSVTSIGYAAFDQCTSLTTVVIPPLVTSIEPNTFSNCNSLTSVYVPQSVISIGESSFWDCSELTTINIPSSVTSIGAAAFNSCISLLSLDIPSSVISIGELALSSSGLITVDPANPNYSSVDGVLFNKDQTSLNQCPTSKSGSYVIPSSVTSIGNYAFRNCNKLTSVSIPVELTSIGSRAFQVCSSLTTITIPAAVVSIGTYAFQACSGLTSIRTLNSTPVDLSSSPYVFYNVNKTTCKLIVPYGSKSTYIAADQWQDFTNIVEVRISTLDVTAGNLVNLLSAEEKNTITNLILNGTIDARDFKIMRDDMPLLAEVDLSDVTIVAYTGTEGTTIFGNNSYPANTISESAFMDNSWQGKKSLISIKFPQTISTIDKFAFYECSNLAIADLPNSVKIISQNAFTRCDKLIQISIPEGVEFIGNQAYYGCSGNYPIFIPSSVITIDGPAFLLWVGLINVDENNPNYSSSEGVLFNKAKTELILCPTGKTGSYIIPTTVETIKTNSFSDCLSLTAITIPTSVKLIENDAFWNCQGLNSITLPTSITSIQQRAFAYCTNLVDIFASAYIPVDLSSLKEEVFLGIEKSTCTLHVPFGSKTAYESANQWQDFENIVEMPGLNLSATLVNLGYAEGSTETIEISSNTTWSTSSDQPWLTVNPTSGSGNGTITLTATLNSNTANRMATVTVFADGAESQIINVTQGFNSPPVANAGSDQYIANGENVTLDGLNSYDINDDPITYLWTAPNGIKLSADNMAQPTFTAPKGGQSTVLSFSLVVNDGTYDSQPDEVIINIVCINNPPDVICNDLTIYIDENGTYSLTQTDLENFVAGTTDDNDSFNKLLIEAEPNNFSCDDVGNNIIVTVTVTDQDVASSSCEATISVTDEVDPTFSKKSYNERVTITSEQTYALPDYSLLFPAMDNCGSVTYLQNPALGEIYSASTKVNISLIATDIFGNYTEAIIKLTVSVKNLKSADIATLKEDSNQSDFKVYPNPFTDRIYFELKLPENVDVSLELFNANGSKLKTIYNGFMQASQTVKFEYIPNKLTTQLIFYKLVVDKEEFSGKLIYKE